MIQDISRLSVDRSCESRSKALSSKQIGTFTTLLDLLICFLIRLLLTEKFRRYSRNYTMEHFGRSQLESSHNVL